MCGRFVRKCTIDEVKEEFEVWDIQWAFEPSYNIAPGQDVAGIVSRDNEKHVIKLRWGLIPFWAKDEKIGYRMINARAETLVQKRSFARSFKSRRCLIIADGFYEWRVEKKIKVPIYMHLQSNRPFGFAGLYDSWKAPDGARIISCTIITTEPNALVKPIHNRMPVILDKDKRDTWLDRNIEDPDELMPLLNPYNPEDMKAYEVTRMVNSPKFNSEDCIKPVITPKKQDLF
jgi:putative SOS response-associated peptidase YedK